MTKYSIRIHPLFILVGIFYILMGSGRRFLCYLIAVIFHEMAHGRVARLRGYELRRITLMPYGAVLKGGENIGRVDSILIALAGPIFNLVISFVIIALWWLFPDLYPYTEELMWANLSLALFNILPIFPLDGARVILSFAKKKAVSLKRLRLVGIVISVLFMCLMIASAFYEFNISLGIMSIFLLHGAISGTEKEMYSHIMTIDNFHKSTIDVLSFLDIGISDKAELYRFLECVRQDRIVTFHILDDAMKEVEVLREEEIRDIILANELSTRFCDVVR